MLPKTKIILIGVGVVVVIIGGTLWGVWRGKRSTAPATKSATGTPAQSANPNTPGNQALADSAVISGEATRAGSLDALATARFVAERFASFSSEARYSNIESLYPLFTSDFLTWAKTYVSTGRDKPLSVQPYRVESRALRVDTQKSTTDAAAFILVMQKQEQTGTATPIVSQKNLKVDLVKTNGTWLVDRLKWE